MLFSFFVFLPPLSFSHICTWAPTKMLMIPLVRMLMFKYFFPVFRCFVRSTILQKYCYQAFFFYFTPNQSQLKKKKRIFGQMVHSSCFPSFHWKISSQQGHSCVGRGCFPRGQSKCWLWRCGWYEGQTWTRSLLALPPLNLGPGLAWKTTRASPSRLLMGGLAQALTLAHLLALLWGPPFPLDCHLPWAL